MDSIATDYLVVGAGAMGMAFTDVLLAESDASVTIVDRHDRPGGHWNDAYPFVRLHQPSSFYGLNSMELSSGRTDESGWNAGLAELASGAEVSLYFQRAMHDRFLPSGQVTYLPMHDYTDGVAISLVTGQKLAVDVATRTADCTYMNVQVPSVVGPAYAVDPEVDCIAPNLLPRQSSADRFTVVGSGKTAMDACLWLLGHGLDPKRITWIRPRDPWMMNRSTIQPGSGAAESLAVQFEIAATATSIEELFDRLEAAGALLRFDPDVTPTMYRCATVTEIELEAMRTIHDVVRLGRVRAIDASSIVLDEGEIPTAGATIVDCTADGLERRPAVDVFGDDTITAQPVRTCQQVFSAAFIGHVECAYDDDDTKNSLCRPVPHPDDHLDWLRTTEAQLVNQIAWSQDPGLVRWLAESRLDPYSRVEGPRTRGGDEIASRLAIGALGAVENLPRLLPD
jgi:hypothetical protein